ncbi:MAG: hypothetical protein IJO51_03765 [Clostridia bacterium]|nr:hypothetical protein [Clostridia bacterium]MBQ9925119.1 hypothetical protein [Clostridia bacterium]
MGTMMEVLDKIMSNIMGVTLGALFMFVGLFIQTDATITWLPNLMIFGGAFVVVMFLSIAVRQYVETVNPQFGRVTAVAQIEEETKNATNAGKAKAFDVQIFFYGIMFVAFSLMGASWQMLLVLLGFCIASEGVALFCNYKSNLERRKAYEERMNSRR